MVFQCINIRQVPWEVLKNAAFGLGFQHLTRDLVNFNAWKAMFEPYNDKIDITLYETIEARTKHEQQQSNHPGRISRKTTGAGAEGRG